MLDLTKMMGDNTYEIKLASGDVIQLNRPTQAIQEAVGKISLLTDKGKEMEAMAQVFKLFTRILNRNTNSKEFKLEELAEEYDVSVAMLVLQDYFQYWNAEVESTVNFQNTPS